jgi:periplasmic divalent cation tolerance protein
MVYWAHKTQEVLPMKDQPIIVLITAPSDEVGKHIASKLVEAKLAACVNILGPIRSIYYWEGKINADEEVLLLVKSRSEIFESHLIPAVQAIHPYQVPEIIALPITSGLRDYLDWMMRETKT